MQCGTPVHAGARGTYPKHTHTGVDIDNRLVEINVGVVNSIIMLG